MTEAEFKRWHDKYLDDLEWRDDVIKTLVDTIAYIDQELSRLRGDFNLMTQLLLTDNQERREGLQRIQRQADANWKKMFDDPEYVERLLKGKEKLDMLDSPEPKGVKV